MAKGGSEMDMSGVFQGADRFFGKVPVKEGREQLAALQKERDNLQAKRARLNLEKELNRDRARELRAQLDQLVANTKELKARENKCLEQEMIQTFKEMELEKEARKLRDMNAFRTDFLKNVTPQTELTKKLKAGEWYPLKELWNAADEVGTEHEKAVVTKLKRFADLLAVGHGMERLMIKLGNKMEATFGVRVAEEAVQTQSAKEFRTSVKIVTKELVKVVRDSPDNDGNSSVLSIKIF